MQHVVSSGALIIAYCTPSNLLNRHRIYALKEKHQIAQLIPLFVFYLLIRQ